MRIFILIILIFCIGCSQQSLNSNKWSLDHFVVFTNQQDSLINLFETEGFTILPDSLSAIHKGQGTKGRVIYFLNTYFEFLHVYDSSEFIKSALIEVSPDIKHRIQGNSSYPFGLGIVDLNDQQSSFESISYHEKWMNSKDSIKIYSGSLNYNKIPHVFKLPISMKNKKFENVESLKKIPEKYRHFFSHSNQVQKLTNISITTPVLNQIDVGHINLMKSIAQTEFIEGNTPLVVLTFDNARKKKIFDLRPLKNLIIKY